MMTDPRDRDRDNNGDGDGDRPAMTPFDEVYDRPDPREFFRTLGPLEYRTPHHAQRIFRRLVEARARSAHSAGADLTAGTPRPLTVLDICCSYGINAALLNHDLTLDDLYAHYTCRRAAGLGTAELAEWDRSWYAAHRRPDAARMVGLDVAPNAIAYARAVGLLDEGFAENLEAGPPSPELLAAARHARLITVTGGASFLSPRTFQPLLAAAEQPVWVAAFVLRTGSYQPIAEGLAPHDLITEKACAPTFPQRRFSGPGERRHAIDAVTEAGEDPAGKESEGYFHTALHLSRPAEDATAFPLGRLVRDS